MNLSDVTNKIYKSKNRYKNEMELKELKIDTREFIIYYLWFFN